MKGRILLVNPWIYDFAAYCEWSEPLGLLSVAALLQENDYQVALVDCTDRYHPRLPSRPRDDDYGCGKYLKTVVDKPSVLSTVPRHYGRYGLPLEVFQEDLESQPRPDVVMVTSGMTYWYPGPCEAIKRIRANFPGVPIVLGGTYATLCRDHAITNSGADYIVSGEGEIQALRLANELTGHESDYDRYEGNLDALPLPLHGLRRNQGYAAIQTSRGCPFHCTYCASSLLHPEGFRRREPRLVVEEMEYCRRQLGIRDFAFYDDALLVDSHRHIHPLLDQLLELGLDCRLHAPNGLHAACIDEDLASKMREAGFRTIRLGLETSNPEEQQRSGGKVSNESFREAVRDLRAAGFEPADITAYVLLGLPGQSLRQVRESVAFAHSYGARVQITLYSLIPGTAEWARAIRKWGIDPQTDPLLHNDSIYPFPWCEASLEEFRQIKAQAVAGNRALASA